MIQAHLFIKGYVQGVGYRQFVKQEAKKRGLTGFVQNLPNGDVEAVLQSSKESEQEAREQLLECVEKLRTGHFLAEVKDIAIRFEEATKVYPDFTIQQFSLE